MSQPQLALRIVKRTRDVVPDEIPVTVKMRRGLDDTAESRETASLGKKTVFGWVTKMIGPGRVASHFRISGCSIGRC